MAGLKNHILVPVDFSEQSLIALGQSYNLARLTKADLTLINVIDESFHLPFFSKNDNKGMQKKIQKELDKLAAETTQKSGIRVNTIIAHGKIYEEIQKAAKKCKSTFIIMGTNGSVGLKRFIGSNALRVVRESPCPVITIKGKKAQDWMQEYCASFGFDKGNPEKINKSIEIARIFGSTIHLVTVLNTDDEFLVNKLRRQMNQVHDHIKEHDVSCTIEFLHNDDVTQSLIDYSKKIKADLIMIMTQEENWTDLMFISSSAQQIINSSDIPVLSIRPKKKKDMTVSVFEY